MALHDFSKEELLGKKYNELLKISKEFGIKTSKRLKVGGTCIIYPHHSKCAFFFPTSTSMFVLNTHFLSVWGYSMHVIIGLIRSA